MENACPAKNNSLFASIKEKRILIPGIGFSLFPMNLHRHSYLYCIRNLIPGVVGEAIFFAQKSYGRIDLGLRRRVIMQYCIS
jgi:hypothetical protein